jgi:hypothetical protein
MTSLHINRRFPAAQGSRVTLAGLVLATLAACGSSQAALTPPTLVATSPADAATAASLNTKVFAAFDMAMDPLGASTFTLRQGSTQVTGIVATSADGRSATFAPSSSLVASSVYTATIMAGAKSAAGAAFAADRSWSFTTGAAADTLPPEVTGSYPPADSIDAAINTKIAATFSEAMDPLTTTTTSFTVKQGNVPVPGSVAYSLTTATFTSTSTLAPNTLVTVALTTDVKDLAGNALARSFTWSFTTGTKTARGPWPVGLGAAGNFAVLAKSAISTTSASTVTGDIGLSPAAASYITGFSLSADSTNVFSTSPQVVGKVYAADYAVPTPSNLTTAVSNLESAYTDAAGRPTPDFLELGTGNIGGKTLVPGLYKWTSTVTVPADVTLSGGANDVWIFQTTGDLTLSAAQHVILSGGALAKNVFWVVAGHAIFGSGAHFEGILLCQTDVTLQTSATMSGRILAQTAVTLQQASVMQPAQ